MPRDIEFRTSLKEKLNEDAEDKEIVKFVLEHAWTMWPHSFEQWLAEKRRYGGFD